MVDSLNVLIVDDSHALRQELRVQFERLGHRVVGEATNGIEALEQISELKPDLVSLDIIMPEMDGIECYRMMRHLESPPRCLLVSALADEDRVVETYGNEISPQHYVSKGCSDQYLTEKVEEVLALPPLPIPEATPEDQAT